MSVARWIGLGVGIALLASLLGVVAWQSGSLLGGASVAFAQGATTPTPTPTTKGPNATDAFWDALAKKLGLSVDDLKAKIVEARKDVIDQWVKAGKLTQAQADALKQRLDPKQPFAPNWFPGRGAMLPRGGPRFGPQMGPWMAPQFQPPFAPGLGRGAARGSLDELEALAKTLKLTPADLTKQLRDGKTLAEIAKAQGVDEATVKQTIIDTAKAQIDRAVKDGTLTQEQGDKLKTNLTPDKIDLSRKQYRFHW